MPAVITAGAIVGGSLLSGYMGSESARKAARSSERASRYSVDEQRRQFDLQRADSQPWRETGRNALSGLYGAVNDPNYGGPALPEFQGGGRVQDFQGGNRFNFDLQADPGYQFARDEAMQATSRAAARGGQNNSGNVLAALNDRATGVASQYADQAFQRQLASSNTNYGRDVGEYDMTRQNNATNYNRDVGEYGMDYSRNQDMYGRDQGRLNWLSTLAGTGQNANAQSAAAGSAMAGNIGNIMMSNAANQGNAAMAGGAAWNNAIQGGIGNALSMYQYNQMMNRLPNYGGGSGYGGYGGGSGYGGTPTGLQPPPFLQSA